MSEWKPIETAKRDRSLVYLRSPSYAPQTPFAWNKRSKRWETKIFAIARGVTAWWDESGEQPTEWRPA